MTIDLVTLFGLKSLISQEDKPKHLDLSDLDSAISIYTAVVTPEGEGNVTCYQPVLANNCRQDEFCKSVIAKPVFLSTRTQRKNLSEFVVDCDILQRLNYDKTIFSGKIITLDIVDTISLESVLNYVVENGSLYVVTDEQELIKYILSFWLPNSFSKFKFSSVLRHIANTESPVTSRPQLIISFHDLRNAIPIYDRKHVEGLAVDVRLFFENEKSISDVVRCWYLLSNYEENVLYIDGEELCTQSIITTKKASELQRFADEAFYKYHKFKKKGKLEEAVKELKDTSSTMSGFTAVGNSVITFSNTTTASFFIDNNTTTT